MLNNRGGYTIVGLKNWFDEMPEETISKPVGRPTMFTAENRKIIYDFLKRGATYALCARRIGVSEVTFYSWLRKGREFRDSDSELTPEENEYVIFVNEMDRLESEYLAGLVEDVSKNNKQWMLTKRMKGEFGDETNINLKADVRTELTWKDLIENVKKED